MVPVKNKRGQESMKPIEVKDYNSSMGGVDRADQLISYCSVPRKTLKWDGKVAFYLLDVCILNASILYNQCNNKKISLLSFRESIISSLQNANLQETTVTTENRSNGFHYLQLINHPTQKRKQASLKCTKLKTRKETVYECATCPENPPLCVQNGFKNWHDEM